MLLEAIRTATKPSHQALEGFLIPNLKGLTNTARYTDILRAFYGFIHPLEKLIEKHIPKNAFPDYDERRKSGALLQDLKSINAGQGSDNDIPLSTAIPQITNAGQAAGALYVLEGSTLGGQIISKMLNDRLGEDISLRYFGGYGERNGAMWGQFTMALDGLITDEKEIEQSTKAATETFTLFHQWLRSQLSKEAVAITDNYEHTA